MEAVAAVVWFSGVVAAVGVNLVSFLFIDVGVAAAVALEHPLLSCYIIASLIHTADSRNCHETHRIQFCSLSVAVMYVTLLNCNCFLVLARWSLLGRVLMFGVQARVQRMGASFNHLNQQYQHVIYRICASQT